MLWSAAAIAMSTLIGAEAIAIDLHVLKTEAPNDGLVEAMEPDGSNATTLGNLAPLVPVSPDIEDFAYDGLDYYTFDVSEGEGGEGGEIRRVRLDGSINEVYGHGEVGSYASWRGFATDGQYFYWLNTSNSASHRGAVKRAHIANPENTRNYGRIEGVPSGHGLRGFATDGIYFYLLALDGSVSRIPIDLGGTLEPFGNLQGSLPFPSEWQGLATAPDPDACRASMRGAPSGTRTPSGLSCSSDPPSPSLLRSVAPIQNDQFVDPHIPPVGTSLDGRVGLNIKGGDSPFYLLRPEELSAPFLDSPAGPVILADPNGETTLSDADFHDAPDGRAGHLILCDPGHGWDGNGQPNPYVCPNDPTDDCYDLTVIAGVQLDATDEVRIYSTPVTARVTLPKTPQAELAEVTLFPGQRAVSPDISGASFREPAVTADGHLLVTRIDLGGYVLQVPPGWTPPPNTDPIASPYTTSQYVDLVYSVPSQAEPTPCSASQWTDFRPVSWAPYDPDLRDGGGSPLYDVAAFPFRDTEGNAVQPGRDIGGTYGWIDRAGRNLFFTTLGDTLHFRDRNYDDGVTSFAWNGRIPVSCPPEVPGCRLPQDLAPEDDPFELPTSAGDPDAAERSGSHRGTAMLGSWTHGKMVLLDAVDPSYFGIQNPDDDHRMVHPFSPIPGRGELAVRVSGGRDNRDVGPPGSVENTTFIASTEHLLNADPDLFPVMPKEVVWIFNKGHGSSEVAFDDFLYPDSFVVSEMVPLVRRADAQDSFLQSIDGFDGLAKTRGWGWLSNEELRLQNAATAPPGRWTIPESGLVHGFARTEPTALGGIRGRGLWLDGQAGVTYEVPVQAGGEVIGEHDWYVGVFVDPRGLAADPVGIRRRLVTFPDDSSVQLEGPQTVNLVDASGQPVHSFTLPPEDEIQDQDWTHLGFIVTTDGVGGLGTRVDFYLDGFLWGRWTMSTDGPPATSILAMGPGALRVGHVESLPDPGIRGWIDEFKVFAMAPNREIACELAYGTLIDVSAAASGTTWRNAAERRPGWVQTEMSDHLVQLGLDPAPLTICFYDHTSDRGVDVVNPPAGAVALRPEYTLPQGPLRADQPRPDTRQNPHCTACHVDSPGRPTGLTLTALEPGNEPLALDARRQPAQPPARIYGHIPADLYGPGVPPAPVEAPPEGCPTDALVLGPLPGDWCDPGGSGGSGGSGGCGLGFEIVPCIALLARLRSLRSRRRKRPSMS